MHCMDNCNKDVCLHVSFQTNSLPYPPYSFSLPQIELYTNAMFDLLTNLDHCYSKVALDVSQVDLIMVPKTVNPRVIDLSVTFTGQIGMIGKRHNTST